MDGAIRQTVGGGEIRHFRPVKTRDAFRRAEPQKTARILFDFISIIAQQTVGDRVGFHRQPLGFGDYRRK